MHINDEIHIISNLLMSPTTVLKALNCLSRFNGIKIMQPRQTKKEINLIKMSGILLNSFEIFNLDA